EASAKRCRRPPNLEVRDPVLRAIGPGIDEVLPLEVFLAHPAHRGVRVWGDVRKAQRGGDPLTKNHEALHLIVHLRENRLLLILAHSSLLQGKGYVQLHSQYSKAHTPRLSSEHGGRAPMFPPFSGRRSRLRAQSPPGSGGNGVATQRPSRAANVQTAGPCDRRWLPASRTTGAKHREQPPLLVMMGSGVRVPASAS